eukprot:12309240-Ditylum_brightwellii.AAC.1
MECSDDNCKSTVEDLGATLKNVLSLKYHDEIRSCSVGHKVDLKGMIYLSLKHLGCSTSLLDCCDGRHEFACRGKRTSG